MRASIDRLSFHCSISVFYIFKCGLHWLDMRASLARPVKFSIVQYNSVFYIYLNAGFTGSTC